MDNHTDISSMASREELRRRGPETTQESKAAKKVERISIIDWMAQTLDEMRRRTGWFKEDPEITRVRQMSAPYPDLQLAFSRNIDRIHRRADVVLKEAEGELATLGGQRAEPVMEEAEALPPTIIEQPYRLLRIKAVDPANREAWNDLTFELIKEYDTAFGKNNTAPRVNDFEVVTFAPTSGTTLGDIRDQGARPIRVRSESVGGVRVDGIVDSRNPNQWSEFRVYETSGHYTTVPGSQDPVDTIMHYAEINAYTLRYALQAKEEKHERNRIIFGERTGRGRLERPFTGEEIIRVQDWRLALPADYERESAAMVRPVRLKEPPAEPAIGDLNTVSAEARREPAMSPLPDRLQAYLPDEPIIGTRDKQYEKMSATYGPEVAQRLEEHLFSNQEDFEDYYKVWELATHNQTLEPEQAMFVRKVFAAIQAEGKERHLMGKGSYGYVVESYKNIEQDLPKLKESIETVKELIQDHLTTDAEKATYQKELGYLIHLKMKNESERNVSLHARVDQFLQDHQRKFTLTEIREIMEADQVLDNAEPQAVEDTRIKLLEAMDYPARLVLTQELEDFLVEYDRFIFGPERQALQQRIQVLLQEPGLLNYWNQQKMQAEYMSSIRGRSWERVARESVVRLNAVLQHYEESLDDQAFAIVSKLREQLTNALSNKPGGKFDLEAKMEMGDILRYHEPVEFERYLTTLLSEVTGQDMRPAWEKSDDELTAERNTQRSPQASSDTFVHETQRADDTMILGTEPKVEHQPATPVEVEWEMEDVSAEIPGLVRALRGVRATPEEATEARRRGRQILEQAGSEEMIEITANMLSHLDRLRKLRRLDDRVYGLALAALLNADNFSDREEVVRTLSTELPTTFLHPLGQHPAVNEIPEPTQKRTKPEDQGKDQENIA